MRCWEPLAAPGRRPKKNIGFCQHSIMRKAPGPVAYKKLPPEAKVVIYIYIYGNKEILVPYGGEYEQSFSFPFLVNSSV